MTMKEAEIHSAFSGNRAEELELDVWREFVVPPFYERLGLNKSKKPKRIVGGRGCGKTMLLRYLCYRSQFSPNRNINESEEISSIGLYWRADTQFLKTLYGRGVSEEEWESLFGHFLTLKVSTEVLESLFAISMRSPKLLPRDQLQSLVFDEFSDYNSELVGGMEDLREALKKLKRQCEYCISNPNRLSELQVVPGQFLKDLVERLRSSLPKISNATFFVYIDEYENLRPYQQQVINTKLKHSEPPLIYNIAMKANGMKTKKTVGEESISNKHDYDDYRIDDFMLEDGNFEHFAAEILLFRLSGARLISEYPDASILQNPDQLDERRDKQYQREILSKARQILPGYSNEELAIGLLENPAMSNLVKREMEKALNARGSSLSAEDFYSDRAPRATIVNIALLNRASLDVEDVLQEFRNLLAQKQNRYQDRTNWIHNNFIGSYLRLHRPHNRVCPYYAGFDTFSRISKGNLRHFLELLRSCSKDFEREDTDSLPFVPPIRQAFAARRASEELFSEIDSFGVLGVYLSRFATELGRIFGAAHDRASQSESEINHFSISDDERKLEIEGYDFFEEAEKWGVLSIDKATKEKSNRDSSLREYTLNPIYAPRFLISFAKKRKLNLDYAQIETLVTGTKDEVSELRDYFERKYGSDLSLGQQDTLDFRP